MRALLVFLAFALIAVPAGAQIHPLSPVITDPTSTAQVTSGDDFFIALASNPTTGYTWSQKTGDAAVAYEGVVYQAPSSGTIGAGGQQIFIFHAVKAGVAQITFTYARPFEPHTPPAKTVTYTVNVK